MFRKRLAALAEILLVLALGNIAGEALFSIVAPDHLTAGDAGDLAAAAAEGLLILFRLGTAGLSGLALLYYRTGITPRQAGLSRNGHPLHLLLAQGFVLGLFSSFLISLLFAVHDLIPFGQGLDAWWTYSETSIDAAFWVYVLGTSVLIPPLTEEIMTRGYFRVRLVESYGTISGVILTGLVFGLSHTRYLQTDSMLLLFLGVILVNSIAWTYLAQRTGSIIPSIVAHALSNGVGTALLFNIWIPTILVGALTLVFSKPILRETKNFVSELHNNQQPGSFWQGLAIIVVVMAATLVVLAVAGRQLTLMLLGVTCLLITLVNLVTEKRQGSPPVA